MDGTAIYLGHAAPSAQSKLVEVYWRMKPPSQPSHPLLRVNYEKYWKKVYTDVNWFFRNDNALSLREQLYFIRKGWYRLRNFENDYGEIEKKFPRSIIGTSIDTFIEKIERNTHRANIVKRLSVLLGKYDKICAAVFETTRDLPSRDTVLPPLFAWASARRELEGQLKSYLETLQVSRGDVFG